MKNTYIIDLLADMDMDEHYEFIAADSLDAALRLTMAAEEMFQRLADMPGIGTKWESKNIALAGMRFCPIPEFRNYLVFYQLQQGTVHIVRVIHGARNIPALFNE